jgi:chlorite dismutase
LATEPICRVCTPDPDDSKWVTVYPMESEPGRWMVTVDVTMQLCAEHKRRLLEAVGMQDVQEYEPPPHPWLQGKG